MYANCRKLQKKQKTAVDEEGPGPSTYHLKPTIGMPKKTDPSLWQSPAYSLRPLINALDLVSSPGPAYKVDRITRHGRETNSKVIIGILLNKKDCVNSPGPAAYLPCYPNLKRAPTPKILLPLKYWKETIIPHPNVNTMHQIDNPAPVILSRKKGYTIKQRTKYSVGEKGVESPGPAAYGPVNADVYKYRAPAKSFGIRTWDNEAVRRVARLLHTDNNASAVVPCVNKSCQGKFTFGIKHSSKCPPYVVPADNSL